MAHAGLGIRGNPNVPPEAEETRRANAAPRDPGRTPQDLHPHCRRHSRRHCRRRPHLPNASPLEPPPLQRSLPIPLYWLASSLEVADAFLIFFHAEGHAIHAVLCNNPLPAVCRRICSFPIPSCIWVLHTTPDIRIRPSLCNSAYMPVCRVWASTGWNSEPWTTL